MFVIQESLLGIRLFLVVRSYELMRLKLQVLCEKVGGLALWGGGGTLNVTQRANNLLKVL